MFAVYLNILSSFIINEYFINSHCLLIFTNNNNSYLNYIGDIPVVKLERNINETKISNYFGCQGIIIESNDLQTDFAKFESLIHSGIERFNHRRYLLLPAKNSKENLTDIFSLKELTYVSDMLILLPKNEDDEIIIDLLTHKYVGSSDNNQPILIDKWLTKNQSFYYGNNLYPNKLKNQLGRKLRMATFTYEPYSIVGKTIFDSYGSELSTAIEFALKHNITPIPVVNEEDYWGTIFENGSGNGLLGNLLYDRADIAALYTWENCYYHLDLSNPLVRTGITCLVPSPKLAAGWLTPLFSYTTELWWAVAVMFFFSIFTFTVIQNFYNKNKIMKKKYRKNKKTNSSFVILLEKSVLYVLKPLLVQPLTKSEFPLQINGKFLMILILVSSLFLGSTYNSGLSSIMTVPRYEKAIDSVEDFAESDLNWGATQDAWITSIQKAEQPKYVKIVNKFIATSEETLRELSKTENFAFSLERLPYENFAIGAYIKEDVIQHYHLMQEDFYWEQCVFMTRKSSILLPSLNDFILRVFEAGLISQWQNKAVVLFMNPQVQKSVKYYNHHSKERAVVKLKWIHVEGAFFALALGYFFSFLVFLLELLRKRMQKGQN